MVMVIRRSSAGYTPLDFAFVVRGSKSVIVFQGGVSISGQQLAITIQHFNHTLAACHNKGKVQWSVTSRGPAIITIGEVHVDKHAQF